MILFCPLRTLNCMVGQMKHILATEQRKTDFRPEDENNVMIQYTTVRNGKRTSIRPALTSCLFLTFSPTCTPPSPSRPDRRPAPKSAPMSVGRWSTCGSPWMGRMWTRCWRSWACVSTDSSTSTYSSTATAQWEACWPSVMWLNTENAPRTSGWVKGQRSSMHCSEGKTWLFLRRHFLRFIK